MAQYILMGYCKYCGAPIFIEAKAMTVTAGETSPTVIECSKPPVAIRSCKCK
jgi:hypothetical protein